MLGIKLYMSVISELFVGGEITVNRKSAKIGNCRFIYQLPCKFQSVLSYRLL